MNSVPVSSSCQYPFGAASMGTRTVGTDRMARDISMWKRKGKGRKRKRRGEEVRGKGKVMEERGRGEVKVIGREKGCMRKRRGRGIRKTGTIHETHVVLSKWCFSYLF